MGMPAGHRKELVWRWTRGPFRNCGIGETHPDAGKTRLDRNIPSKGDLGKEKNADNKNRNYLKNESFGTIDFIMEKRYFPCQMG